MLLKWVTKSVKPDLSIGFFRMEQVYGRMLKDGNEKILIWKRNQKSFAAKQMAAGLTKP
jgi:hypothetical protein